MVHNADSVKMVHTIRDTRMLNVCYFLLRTDVRPFILKGSTDGGSKSSSSSTWWRHIIPLDKLTVNKEGIVELDKVTDYGTHNYYA